MNNNDKTPFEKWNDFYLKMHGSGGNIYPQESLIRIFKGNYVTSSDIGRGRNYDGMKIIDIGFGSGNNLAFFGALGMQLYGVEVYPDICKQATEKLRALGYEADLRPGDNRNMPFPDNMFDYLISWDVIHYENNEELITDAIKEYHRILKPGGRFLISTVAPEHSILRKSKTVGCHRYEIGREDDMRKGQIFFYFDSPGYIEYYLSKYFSGITIGRSNISLFSETIDTFIATGLKQKG